LPTTFDEQYRCYPVSFCDKDHLEDGDKILLPPSALDTLARLHIDYPMLFRLENEHTTRHTHCGVLEFSAPEGSCYLPYWMMQNLCLTEGSLVHVKNVTLPKATFVKIRPQSIDFLDISNPRAVLEASLRKFSCMTVGDTICLRFNENNYFLDVRQVKPEDAACIIETDCEVDFEPPVDYVPPSASSPPTSSSGPPPAPQPFGGIPTMESSVSAGNPALFKGTQGGLRLGSDKKMGSESSSCTINDVRSARLQKYAAFQGTGQTMSGKSVPPPPSMGPSPGSQKSSEPLSSSKNESMKQKPTTMAFSGPGRRLR